MKSHFVSLSKALFVLAASTALALSPRANAQYSPPMEPVYQLTNGELDVFGQAVVELLQSRGVTHFAADLSGGSNDWMSVVTTNLSRDDASRISTFAKGANYNQTRLGKDAQAMLDRADSLHLKFSDGAVNYEIIPPKHVGWIYLSNFGSSNALVLPYVNQLEIHLTRAPETHPPDAGDFVILIRGVQKFPTGWRINEGVQWSGFPTNVADARTLWELAMLNKMTSYQPITSDDDPSLMTLGQSLVHFIQERDTTAYEKELLMNSDTLWAMIQKSGRPGPSRKEVDEEVASQDKEQVTVARKMIKLMSDNGIDLTSAAIRIESASIGHCQSEGGAGTVDNLMGSDFQLKLSVQTAARASNGVSLAGEYVIGAQQIQKFGDDWKVSEGLHWEKLPDWVVDSNTVANIQFENYVSKYRSLPPGTAAPEIHFTSLDGGKAMKLSDLRGKVVVLDFWATWCGPCQEPMAELQKLRDAHPEWKDRVAIVPVSIDDTMKIVRNHVNQHGWTNTFNVWAGDGGWHSATAQAFRVTAVPTSYVLDTEGKVVWSGFPMGDNIPNEVDAQLKN
jgi:thiol-disulfide isomerase/thioredoxin